MRLFFITFLILLSLDAIANGHMLKETQYKYVEQSIGKGKPYFLELGSDSCYSCKVMGELLYKVSQKHPEYNIYFINVKKERDVALQLEIRMIPTQIIYDKNGKEVYRHIGLLREAELADLFKKYLF